MLITFEGIDGSGKTTQAEKLLAFFLSKNIRTWLTKEPTDFIFPCLNGNNLHKVTSNSKNKAFLYLADRAIHVEGIKVVMENKNVVICDRYVDSTLAYQGYGDEDAQKINLIKLANNYITQNAVPNLTFLLQTPISECRKRKNIEHDDNYLNKVAHGYDIIAKSNPSRFYVIAPEKAVFNEDFIFYRISLVAYAKYKEPYLFAIALHILNKEYGLNVNVEIIDFKTKAIQADEEFLFVSVAHYIVFGQTKEMYLKSSEFNEIICFNVDTKKT